MSLVTLKAATRQEVQAVAKEQAKVDRLVVSKVEKDMMRIARSASTGWCRKKK